MCIVIDANAAHKLTADDADGVPVLTWLLKRRGKLVVSQALLRELSKTSLRDTLRVLDQAGQLCRASEPVCKADIDHLLSTGLLKSNDVHIVALIRATGCDLVFTQDQALHEDIKNKKLVAKCRIYQKAGHSSLLGDCRCV